MSVKQLPGNHLKFLRLIEAAQARLSLHLSKYLIVGNHMSRLNFGNVCRSDLAGNTHSLWQCRSSNIPSAVPI